MDLIPAQPQQRTSVRRRLARMMKKMGTRRFSCEPMGVEMTYEQFLAVQIWDLVATGECFFADGSRIRVADVKEWLDVVKFLGVHCDGPAVMEGTFNQLNVFKIYNGIDESKI